jgi:hypothetical protein
MKGGVELTVKWFGKTTDEAVTFFLENATFRIFTNSSISCITLIAKLNRGIESPFLSIDSLNFAKSITSILLKIMPSTDVILSSNKRIDKASIPGRILNYDGIEINSFETIERETSIQKDIFRKSIISPLSYLDSICPSLIHVINPVTNKQQWKKKFLDSKIIPREGKNIMSEMVLINQIFSAVNIIGNKPADISIILMEFMEGYKVLNDLTTHTNYGRFQQYALYELHQLHLFGYLHGDSHTGNIMVHPDIQHFSITNEPKHIGIIKIIDFGRTMPLLPEEKLMIKYPNYDFRLIAKERLFASIFGNTAIINPDISKFLQTLITTFSKKRIEFIEKILQTRLKPFYDFRAMPESERSPDKLLRDLFPESHYGGLRLKNSRKNSRKTKYLNTINTINNIKESSYLQNRKMKKSIYNNSSNKDIQSITNETEFTNELDQNKVKTSKSFLEFNPDYDWDKGRTIVGNTLSIEEKKMSIEDFKNRISEVLIQNDNDKIFNIPLFLEYNLVSKNKKGGGVKYKSKTKPKTKSKTKTKKSIL